MNRNATEFADRNEWTVHCQWRNNRIHPAAVWKPGIYHRLGLVNAPPHCGNNLIDYADEMPRVLEVNSGLFQPTLALNIDRAVSIDENIVDRVVLEQRLQWT